MEHIMMSRKNLMTAQNSKPNITVVQDNLLAWYLATHGWVKINKDDFYNMSMKMDKFNINQFSKSIERIISVYSEKGIKRSPFNGKALFSLLLPSDMNYSFTTNASKEPDVVIYKGVLISGCLTKKVLGGSIEGLLPYFYKEYREDITCDFINNINFVGMAYISRRGFTIGIGDCLVTKTEEIEDAVNKAFVKASMAEDETDPSVRELKICTALNEARDVGNKVAKMALKPGNNIRHMVVSGTKGDYANILQVTGILGQQNYDGGVITPSLCHGTKSLPHYRRVEDIDNQEDKHESRGFIRNNFLNGLKPTEMWFHHIVGRRSITDTACKTSDTGYLQRKMVKVWEDYKIAYDGSVRSANGAIIQFVFGDNGLDPLELCHVKGKGAFPINVERMVNKLNTKFENASK
jgi:DNA-directed RNA polymerase beta' subunit